MIEEAVFTIHEISRAFRISEGRVKAWIRKGKLKGYLLDGFLNYHVEVDSLVKFQEKYPRYQYAVLELLELKGVKYLVINSVRRENSLLAVISAIFYKPGYVKWWKEHLREPRMPFIPGRIRIVLKEDWEKSYDVKEELKTRHKVLSAYRAQMDRLYAPHPGRRRVEAELEELEGILIGMDQEN
jgi:hypothetical protein